MLRVFVRVRRSKIYFSQYKNNTSQWNVFPMTEEKSLPKVSAILGIELKMSNYDKTLLTLNTFFNLPQQF